jgi:hypothetical protein
MKEENKNETCGCNCNHNEEEIPVEDIVAENNILLNAVIDILIEKKIISEDDLRNKIAEMEEETEDTEDEEAETDDTEDEESEKAE